MTAVGRDLTVTQLPRLLLNLGQFLVTLIKLAIFTIPLIQVIEKPKVNAEIDGGNESTKAVLYFPCETVRIDNSKQIVLHKAFTVPSSPGFYSKRIL